MPLNNVGVDFYNIKQALDKNLILSSQQISAAPYRVRDMQHLLQPHNVGQGAYYDEAKI